MRTALLIGFVLLISLVSPGSAETDIIKSVDKELSIQNHVMNIDSAKIPGDDYVSSKTSNILGTYDKPRMYRQISEHVYYSPSNNEMPHESVLIKYGDTIIV